VSQQDIKAFFAEWKQSQGEMQQALPETLKGFHTFYQCVMKDGVLSFKQKELIALAIGLALRCAPCVYLHTRKALQLGATREEILEVAGVVLVMQGGPAATYIPEVLKTLEACGA